MSAAILAMAFLMGITGGMHCAGMCGPIALIMPFRQMSGSRKIIGLGVYHFARISVYALMGALLYSFKSLFNPAWQQWVAVAAGSVLLIVGLASFLQGHFRISFPWAGIVTRKLGAVMGSPSIVSLAVAGALNGLLPCGLVYMVLSASLTMMSAWSAVGMIYVFGIGTVPVLVIITLFAGKVPIHHMALVKRAAPLVVFVFGCVFILRGLNLGIPYLSPKVEMTNGTVYSSCCHKK